MAIEGNGKRRDYNRGFLAREIVRLVFLGSPSFAVPSLEAVLEAGHDVVLVVSQPDRPAGRGQKTTPSAIAAYARTHHLALWQTSSLRGAEALERLRQADADAMALAAFAALVPQGVLDLTPRGILNVHPSLLPRWRGAAPIQAALANGDAETGVSIIRLVEALDAGPIFIQQRVTIDPADDYVSLEPRLARIGAVLLVQTLATWPEPAPQGTDGVTFAPRIERDDARLDWSRPAQEIVNSVRAYRGWPQAFTTWNARLLKILRASTTGAPADLAAAPPGRVGAEQGNLVVATGNGWVRLDEVQLEGKRAMTGAELARGYTDLIGADLA